MEEIMTNKEIAQTIFAQLGGNRFKAMTGAHSFVADEKALIFKVPRVGMVKISLRADDTYDMEFLKVRNLKVKKTGEYKGVYFDMLQSLFTEHTGLYTSL